MQQQSTISNNRMRRAPLTRPYTAGSEPWRSVERIGVKFRQLFSTLNAKSFGHRRSAAHRSGIIASASDSRTDLRMNPVKLAELLVTTSTLRTGKIVLGVDERRQAVMLNLRSEEAANVLITGANGAGKTSLLRTIASSVAFENRQSTVQIGVIDLEHKKLTSRSSNESLSNLSLLPHTLFPVIGTLQGGYDVINFLAAELDYRRAHKVAAPLVVIIIDGVDQLLANAERALYRKLGHLLNHGPKCGYRFFITASDPLAKEMRPLLKYDFPLRLVGKSIDADRAWAATGTTGSNAENLAGYGDFIAVRGENQLRFQAAFFSHSELGRLSSQFDIQKGRAILTQPMTRKQTRLEKGEPDQIDYVVEKNPSNGSIANQDPIERANESGSDEWLIADWMDRFWMGRN